MISAKYPRDESASVWTASRIVVIGAILVVGAIAALWADLYTARTVRIDNLPGDLKRVLGLMELFGHVVGVALVAWLAFCLMPNGRRKIPRLIACAIVPGIAVNFFKLTVGRFRPGHYGLDLPSTIGDTFVGGVNSTWAARGELGSYAITSFPSGHAATAIGLAIGLAWLFPAGRIPFLTVAILASIQRITHGAHWLSDTLMGAALAVIVAGCLLADNRLGRAWARFEAEDRLPDEGEVRRAA
jgi:membrane-associated phospholipid phosphatase